MELRRCDAGNWPYPFGLRECARAAVLLLGVVAPWLQTPRRALHPARIPRNAAEVYFRDGFYSLAVDGVVVPDSFGASPAFLNFSINAWYFS